MSSRYLTDLKKRKSKIIYIYVNGEKYRKATLIILRPIEQKGIERIFRAVEEKIKLPNSKPIKRIFTIEGEEIEDPSKVEDQTHYVVGSSENFIKTNYGTIRYWTMVGPVRWGKYRNLFSDHAEQRVTPTIRRTYDNWKIRSYNRTKISSKLTESMCAFTGDKRAHKKDKNMSMSIDHLQRPESEPSNDIDPRIIRHEVMSKKKEESSELLEILSDLGPSDNNEQMEQFLTDSIRMSADGKIKEDMPTPCSTLPGPSTTGEDVLIKTKTISNKEDNILHEKKDGNNKSANSPSKECRVSPEKDTDDLKLKEKAATVIQSNFRGHLVREHLADHHKDLSTQSVKIEEHNAEEISAADHAATIIQANFRGHLVREHLADHHKDLSTQNVKIEEHNADEISTADHAATVIQANFRGHLVREHLADVHKHPNKPIIEDEQQEQNDSLAVEHAAVVIQSNFRGFLVREDLKKTLKKGDHNKDLIETHSQDDMSNEKVTERKGLKDDGGEDQIKIDEELPDKQTVEKAATIIQSNFRGHLVREKIKHPCKETEKITVESEENNMESAKEEKAATVIQANFKGHLVRENLKVSPKNTSKFEDEIETENSLHIGSDRTKETIEPETVKEENSDKKALDKDLECQNSNKDSEADEENLKAQEKAAVIIQSNFRGHLTRTGLKSSSNVIVDFESDEEQERSYAVRDSDDEEEDLNYSPSQTTKYTSNYSDNAFDSIEKN